MDDDSEGNHEFFPSSETGVGLGPKGVRSLSQDEQVLRIRTFRKFQLCLSSSKVFRYQVGVHKTWDGSIPEEPNRVRTSRV